MTRTYPNGTVTTYTYDADGRLAGAASGGTTTSYAYDPASELLSVATPDGFIAGYSYDRAGRQTGVANTSTAGTLSRFTYTLDAAGNRTSMTTIRGTMVFSYDAASRLTGVCYSGCPAAAATLAPGAIITRAPEDNPPAPGDTFTNWTYDPVGNRLTQANYLGTTTYAYDATDRLTSATPPGSGAVTSTYDANGNELSAGASTYAYNLANELVSATVGATTQTYTYGGDGIRLSAATGSRAANTTQFVVDRAFPLPTVVSERDGSGKLLRRYVYGLDLLSQTTPTKGPYWYHHDGLGSVSDITSSSGTSLSWAEYQPFGLVRASGSTSQAPINPFMFAGQYQDTPTGLYHLRARQYDPTTGRFLSVDPVAAPIGDPYVGAYVYAKGSPVRYVDPSGRDTNGVCITAEGALAFLFGEAALCVVVSDTGQGGVVLTLGGGGGVGLGGTAGVSILRSNAAEIYDLESLFVVSGGSGAALVGLQGEGFVGAGHCGQVVGGAMGGVVVGATGSVQGGATDTFVLFGVGAPKSGCSGK